jgi:hypothetical protein
MSYIGVSHVAVMCIFVALICSKTARLGAELVQLSLTFDLFQQLAMTTLVSLPLQAHEFQLSGR